MKLSTKIILITFILILVGVGAFVQYRYYVHRKAKEVIESILKKYPAGIEIELKEN